MVAGQAQPISATWLAWYTTGMLLLLAVMSSAISYAPPGPTPVEQLLPVVFLGGAIVTVIIATILGRLPRTHWVHEARSIRVGFVVVAVTVTMLAALVG